MTIRYKCEECDSVLKIRDELAGTSAKCPKCKTKFTIPQPEAVPAGAAAGSPGTSAGETAEDLPEKPVDMPRELTPMPELAARKSAAAVLDSSSGSGLFAAPQDSSGSGIRPSVADLMKEHQEKKKQKDQKREKRKAGSLADAAAAAEAMTAGTAADALNRNYDQKRGHAGEPPPLTREERRQLEQKEALQRALKTAGPFAAGGIVILALLISWFHSEKVPDLYDVTGVVTVAGAPMEGLEVRFAPILADDNQGEAGQQNSSAGRTDAEGRYELMYNEDNEGAIEGRHRVIIQTDDGIVYTLPPGEDEKTVSPSEDNQFDFNL